MNIQRIKEELLTWQDYYGQDIVCTDVIEKSKTKEELSSVLKDHIRFLQDQNVDAVNHAESFRKRLGL